MHARIDVLARVSDIGDFRRLLVSLDAQSLSPTEFAVVAVPDGLDDAGSELLQRLAGYRPNLVVAEVGAGWTASGTTPGAYVLPMGHDEVLLPGGLARLADALGDDPDVVVARGVVPGQLTDWQLYAETTALASTYDALDFAHVAVLVRREHLSGLESTNASLGELRHAGVAAARTVRALDGAPVLEGPSTIPEARGQSPVWAEASWTDRSLAVEIDSTDETTAVSYVSLRSLDSGIDWRLAWEPRDGGLRLRIDPATAADGEPLARGRWVMDLQTAAGTVHAVRWRESPGSVLLGALLVGAVKGKGERLLLDLGATRRSPFRDLDPAAAEIEEDARGTELRWPLPLAFVAGDEVLPAGVRLGDFPLVAQVRAGAGEAVLHAWLSGLAGRTPLAVAIAGSPYHDSGFDLEIALTGEMALVPREIEESRETAAASTPRRAVSGLTERLRPRRSK